MFTYLINKPEWIDKFVSIELNGINRGLRKEDDHKSTNEKPIKIDI